MVWSVRTVFFLVSFQGGGLIFIPVLGRSCLGLGVGRSILEVNAQVEAEAEGVRDVKNECERRKRGGGGVACMSGKRERRK